MKNQDDGSLEETVIQNLADIPSSKGFAPGEKIGRFEITSKLGKGGMGEVYLAHDRSLGRQVAIKVLLPEFTADSERVNRFKLEAKAASALNHPNIITIHEVGEDDDKLYIATEHIDGETLRSLIDHKKLDLASSIRIAEQVASALAAAHKAGIIHRDIKPENIMIREDGFVKVLDFGLAKPMVLDAEADTKDLVATKQGMIMGSVGYMSPEQARGLAVDARTDLWSLGVVFYEMLSGKAPFHGDTMTDILANIIHKEPQPVSEQIKDAPTELYRIVKKSLRKEADERYQTAKDFSLDLKNLRREMELEQELELSVSPSRLQEIRSRSTDLLQTEQTENATKMLSAAISTETSVEIARVKKNYQRGIFAVIGILLLAGLGYFGYSYFLPTKQIESIAVMPFVNESGNADVEYLADGMTETLISSLSNIPNLSVKARSTVFYYKGKEASPQKIGEELKVQAVLLGRVSQRGDDLKLSLELVNTQTQDVIWSEQYNRKQSDLVSLQSEIAKTVSDKLRLKLTATEQERVSKTYTTSSEAQQFYLKGRFHWNKRRTDDFQKAREYFQQAIANDPNYALAHTGLADTLALMPYYGNFRPSEYMPLAKQSAQKALELDPNLAEAHASLGQILTNYDYDFKGAERELRRAIELDPKYASAYQWLSEVYMFSGNNDQALSAINKALELDPLAMIINNQKGNVLRFMGKQDEAIAQYKKTIELFPDALIARSNLANIYEAKGMHSEAFEHNRIVAKLAGVSPEDIKERTCF